jgi:hypothetical protein
MTNQRESRNKVPPVEGATYEEYRAVCAGLELHLNRLKQMAEKYPIFLMISGVRYRFESPDEVDEFVAQLRAEVARYAGTAKAC